MRCNLLSIVLAVALVPVPSARAEAAGADETVDAAPPSLIGAVLETQMIPDLRQTIVYARFPDAVNGAATLEFLDADGRVRASTELVLIAGTGLFVWDGRDAEGEPVPSDSYVARLTFAGAEWTAPLIR